LFDKPESEGFARLYEDKRRDTSENATDVFKEGVVHFIESSLSFNGSDLVKR
jgi:hypothetical protein